MTDDLLGRLTNPMVPYDPEVDAQGFWEDLCADAKDRIEALTAERDKWREAHGQACASWYAQCQHEMNQTKAVEKQLQEMQAHIDHADAYHKAMLVAEAETRMTMAELADWTARAEAAEADNARLLKIIDAIVDEYDGQMHGPILHTINEARALLDTGKETK
jgi:hypothetical protein